MTFAFCQVYSCSTNRFGVRAKGAEREDAQNGKYTQRSTIFQLFFCNLLDNLLILYNPLSVSISHYYPITTVFIWFIRPIVCKGFRRSSIEEKLVIFDDDTSSGRRDFSTLVELWPGLWWLYYDVLMSITSKLTRKARPLMAIDRDPFTGLFASNVTSLSEKKRQLC